MKKVIYLLPALGMLFTACEKKETPTGPTPPNPSSYYTADADSALDATSTKSKDASITDTHPGDQADSYADRPWLRKIRQAIAEDKDLESQAGNIKIVIIKGTINLKGTVPNEKAKADLVKKVKQVVGDRKVEDQTEVSK
ncbi:MULTISPECIES: BON domain-containing protein [Parachlamydia]|jgi:osmotically-inducible protein OsmY|uniref:BON domain-containing protein n=2 Tax=Parachlamydia acanthamoebae TaxID=83552 RepID=F8L0W0_PARAV|nr:BON domain-containing protein [Parachlamydia acanthamoebae]EFB42659.1 hypothetical protein pah_c004o197 [Parachlamydia acanthamoebae str. Hall's coccus]KIA77451.1 hypothetical protein DB43_GG00300 [Parachlamydia acanthamoebae]CCB86867.1 putative uncharacterized protein [Parachlamydia acanthamoebae UV-7]